MVIIIKEDLAAGSKHDHGTGRQAFDFHDALHLLFLVFTCEDRVAYVELVENASKRPDVDSWCIPDAHHNLGGTIESALNVGVELFSFVSSTTKVYHFYSTLVRFPQENIFRLHVTMHNLVLLHVVQCYQ